MTPGSGPGVAVLDVGKSNVKLRAMSEHGDVLETLATPNPSLPGPPYRHHNLARLEAWLIPALADLAQRHAITAIVPCGHGSGAVLVDDYGPILPMIDYEQNVPEAIDRAYRAIAGSYLQRGSAIMLGAPHTARQLFWQQHVFPEEFARAQNLLHLPQYWAWRLCGVAATEISSLGAQSHLWDTFRGCYAPIVERQGWQKLLPPLRPAWEVLGTLLPDLSQRTGLPPGTAVLCGVHDSTANLYRYQAAGLQNFAVVSTGTWIVALSDSASPDALDEARGMTCNADVTGRPLAGALAMGGREFEGVAGNPADPEPAAPSLVAALVGRGTMALPSYGPIDGIFPGCAGRGRIVGPPPENAAQRKALGVLYTALLTDACLDVLGRPRTVVLDGSFVSEKLYAGLVASLRPGQDVRVSREAAGPAAGAALLACHLDRTAPIDPALDAPTPLDIPGLTAYRARWKERAGEPAEF